VSGVSRVEGKQPFDPLLAVLAAPPVTSPAVNAHIRSIYAKPGAGDRSSAVPRARELRLLSAGSTR